MLSVSLFQSTYRICFSFCFYFDCLQVNVTNNALDTPLHIATRLRNERIAAMLCEYGADPNFKNKDNMTAVDLAYEAMDRDMISLLSPDAQLSIGMTQRARNSALLEQGIDYVLQGINDEVCLLIRDRCHFPIHSLWFQMLSMICLRAS